jgi:hypothetical protein
MLTPRRLTAVANAATPAAKCAVFRAAHDCKLLVIAGSAELVASFTPSCCSIVVAAARLNPLKFFQQEAINVF